MDRTAYGRSFPMLTSVDKFTRNCQAIVSGKQLPSEDVLEHLSELIVKAAGHSTTAARFLEWLTSSLP